MPYTPAIKHTFFADITHTASRIPTMARLIHSDIINQLGGQFSPFFIIADNLPARQKIDAQLAAIADAGFAPADVILIVVQACNSHNATAEWEIMQTGIKDIYSWGGEDDFKNYLLHGIQRQQKVSTILLAPLVKDNLIGESAVWKRFLSSLIEAALFSQCSFLLTGQSGTGKELISRLIHTIDNRPDKQDLVLVDCTTVVPELSGSEFFGHEKGAYTNAMQGRDGAFALANRGSLFLDEIGELPMALQAGLLRVIQEGTYKKVGSNTWQKTNFRLVCATHRNLRSQVQENKFRQDLFYRISDFEFHVPSLEERKDDIPLLANFFMQQLTKGGDVPGFDNNVMELLVNRPYPGNIRELRQLVQRIALRHVRHKKITIGELPPEERVHCTTFAKNGEVANFENIIKQMVLNGENYSSIKEKAGAAAYEAAIELCGGKKQLAAERLGVNVRSVQNGIKKKL